MLRYLSPGLLGIVLQSETSWLDHIRSGFIPVAYGVMLLTLLAVVIALVLALFRALGNGDVPKVESWDGFGGGLGGWQMSRSLVLLLGAVLFSSVAAVTVRSAAADLKQQPTPQATRKAAADTTATQRPAQDSTSAGADSAKAQTRTTQQSAPQARRSAPPPVQTSTTTWQ